MMNKSGFLTLNLILSSNILKYPVFALIYLIWIAGDELNIQMPDSIWLIISLGISFGIFISFWLLKIFIFIFLFKKSKKGTYTYDFFRKFMENETFQDNTLSRALLSDALFFTLEAIIFFVIRLLSESGAEFFNFIAGTFIVWLITGTGTLLSYFSLSLWLSKKKAAKN